MGSRGFLFCQFVCLRFYVLGIIGHILKENKVKVFIIESQNGYMCGYLIGTTNGSNFYYT